MVRDITERKEREQELERQNERLDRFASVVSHDLRNPLNVASGRLELAQLECDSDHLDDVADAIDRMETLTDDLLTLARQGEQVQETEPVMLAEMVDGCWQSVKTANATLVCDTKLRMQANKSRLKQLLENVFRNSVEHGGDDVTVIVDDLDDRDGFYVADVEAIWWCGSCLHRVKHPIRHAHDSRCTISAFESNNAPRSAEIVISGNQNSSFALMDGHSIID